MESTLFIRFKSIIFQYKYVVFSYYYLKLLLSTRGLKINENIKIKYKNKIKDFKSIMNYEFGNMDIIDIIQ
jgi:uncharacterized protein YutD